MKVEVLIAVLLIKEKAFAKDISYQITTSTLQTTDNPQKSRRHRRT